MSEHAIPLIDITPLRDGSNPLEVAKALHAASSGPGFIYVTGHGMSEDLIDRTREAGLEFFRNSSETKEKIRVSDHHRGWIGQGNARMADDVMPDIKESFIWGFEDEEGVAPDHPLRGPNQWPSGNAEFEATCQDYFREVHLVAEHLMRGFALGLDLDADFFLKTSDRPISRCSFVYYPPQTTESKGKSFGVGPHTDFGVLTVLCQDSVGGLEVETPDGEWIAAPPIPGSLVVNVGDLLARWTDGAYRSTPHRVINRTQNERLSLVLAYDPNPSTVIDARNVFGPEYTPKEQQTTCGEYLTWRFGKAFSEKARA